MPPNQRIDPAGYHRWYRRENRVKLLQRKAAQYRKPGERERQQVYAHKYYLKHKAELKAKREEYKQLHPDRARAHELLKEGRKSRLLIPEPCAKCGDTKVDGHHFDYSKPLEVIWLCREHHAAKHRTW